MLLRHLWPAYAEETSMGLDGENDSENADIVKGWSSSVMVWQQESIQNIVKLLIYLLQQETYAQSNYHNIKTECRRSEGMWSLTRKSGREIKI